MATEPLPPLNGKKNFQLRSIATITIFTLGGQALALVTQIVITAAFGAGSDMDAFLAASAAPQYLVTIVLGTLGFVFIPVFVQYNRQRGDNLRHINLGRFGSGRSDFCQTVAAVDGTRFVTGVVGYGNAGGYDHLAHNYGHRSGKSVHRDISGPSTLCLAGRRAGDRCTG
jgi:hypothetical protein